MRRVPGTGSLAVRGLRAAAARSRSVRSARRPCPDGLATCFAAGEYDGLLRAMILAHKERAAFTLADPLGQLLAVAAGRTLEPVAPTVLVPVPSRRCRGALARARPDAPDRPGRGAVPAPARAVRQRARRPARQCAARSGPGRARAPRQRAANLAGSMRVRPAARQALARIGAPVSLSCCATTCSRPARPRARRSVPSRRRALRVRAVVTVAATRKRLEPGRSHHRSVLGPTPFGPWPTTVCTWRTSESAVSSRSLGQAVRSLRILPLSTCRRRARAAQRARRVTGPLRGQESSDNQIVTRLIEQHRRSAVDVVVSSRHCEVSDRFREHVEEKLARLEKHNHRIIRVEVLLEKEARPREPDRTVRVELTAKSKGPIVRAEACCRGQDGCARPGAGQDGRPDAPRRRPPQGAPWPAQARVARRGDGPQHSAGSSTTGTPSTSPSTRSAR